MIVRLKGKGLCPGQTKCERFQFYDSPIKSKNAGRETGESLCFNSMIVRLKDYLTNSKS